jgi:hypothetical protein
VKREARDKRERRDPKFVVRSSENLELRTSNLRVSPVSPVSRGNPAGAKRPYTISINNSINAYESPLIRLDADDDEWFICQLAGEMVQFGKLP